LELAVSNKYPYAYEEKLLQGLDNDILKKIIFNWSITPFFISINFFFKLSLLFINQKRKKRVTWLMVIKKI